MDTETFNAEVEALSAIYGDDFEFSASTVDYPQVRVRPSASRPEVEVHIQTLPGYPGTIPVIAPHGLPDDASEALLEVLLKTAGECVGEAMLYNIAQAANEWLEAQTARADTDTTENENPPHTPTKAKMGKQTGDGGAVSDKKKASMRTANDVINRIRWDADLDTRDFFIAYLDRFEGIMVDGFNAFDWADLPFPQHRIQYFKYKDEIVWDKRGCGFDNVFGSRGDGKKLDDVIAHHSGQNENDQKEGEDDPGGTESESEPDEDEAGTSGPSHRVHANANRPNFFVCFRVTDPKIQEGVKEVQDRFAMHDPVFNEGMVPLTAMHVTVCMLRINTDDQMQKAKQVLQSSIPELVSILPQSLEVGFEGVGDFRDRLVYIKPREVGSLDWLAHHLRKRFEDVGVRTPGNHAEFSPHTSIIRLSRAMCKKMNVNHIDRGLALPFVKKHFGTQRVDGLYLCHAGPENRQGGFYKTELIVGNNLLDVHPLLKNVLLDRLNDLEESDVIDETKCEEIRATLQKDASQNDAMLEVFEDAGRWGGVEIDVKKEGLVVILRGLPGSGKSYIVQGLRDQYEAAVCSADSYFEGNEYKYQAAELAAAHKHCLEKFVHAMASKEKLVVVDNTHSREWEYALFLRVGRLCGYHVEVVEIGCPDIAALKAFSSRCTHNVPFGAMQKMFERWECDASARIIQPYLMYEATATDPYRQVQQICMEHTDHRKAGKPEVLYTAVFLTAKSRTDLVRRFPPEYENVSADHVTLAFQPGRAHAFSLPLGSEVKMRVWGVADDGMVQAVAVDFLSNANLDCQKPVPHVTLSVAEGAEARMANDLLTKNDGAAIKACKPMEIEGTATCVVNFGDSSHRPVMHVVDKEHLEVLLEEGECEEEVESSVWVGQGNVDVNEICIFDFDGTLFDTPSCVEGMREYKRRTGKDWPLRGWYGRAESLMSPLHVYPGPAMCEFFAHHRRPGIVTVVLTGRLDRTKMGVQGVLDRAGVEPDRLILKNTSGSTDAFKANVILGLLEEFPTARVVKLWDDLTENLAAFHRLSRRRPEIEWEIIDALSLPQTCFEGTRPFRTKWTNSESKSGVSLYLSTCGSFPTAEWKTNSRSGIEFITEAWGAALGMKGSPKHLAMVFGSYGLGRSGDVDLCLIAPESMDQKACIRTLKIELERRGVKEMHVGYGVRCPRLKVKLEFSSSPPIEYDLVFCRLGGAIVGAGVKSVDELMGALKTSDQASKRAGEGVVFLSKIQEAARDARGLKQVAVVVETLSRMLMMNNLKGNAFHCPRTFHLLKLVGRCLGAAESRFESADDLLVQVLTTAALMSDSDWCKLFGDSVPREYIPRVKWVFKRAESLVRNELFPKWELVHTLFGSFDDEQSMEGYKTVKIVCGVDNGSSLWGLKQFLEARSGTHIRRLLEWGCMVLPVGISSPKTGDLQLEFRVPESAVASDGLSGHLDELLRELENYDSRLTLRTNVVIEN